MVRTTTVLLYSVKNKLQHYCSQAERWMLLLIDFYQLRMDWEKFQVKAQQRR